MRGARRGGDRSAGAVRVTPRPRRPGGRGPDAPPRGAAHGRRTGGGHVMRGRSGWPTRPPGDSGLGRLPPVSGSWGGPLEARGAARRTAGPRAGEAPRRVRGFLLVPGPPSPLRRSVYGVLVPTGSPCRIPRVHAQSRGSRAARLSTRGPPSGPVVCFTHPRPGRERIRLAGGRCPAAPRQDVGRRRRASEVCPSRQGCQEIRAGQGAGPAARGHRPGSVGPRGRTRGHATVRLPFRLYRQGPPQAPLIRRAPDTLGLIRQIRRSHTRSRDCPAAILSPRGPPHPHP